MSTEQENPVTPPAASKGVMERIAAKLGIKSESEIVAGLNEEITLLTAAANDAQAELEMSKAEVTRQSSVITGLQAKISGIEAAVPGLSTAADPGALVLQAITKATTDKIAEMGMAAGTAPGTDPSPSQSRSLDEQYAELKTTEEKAAFLKANAAAILK